MGILISKRKGQKKISTDVLQPGQRFVPVRIANEEASNQTELEDKRYDNTQDNQDSENAQWNNPISNLRPELSRNVLAVLHGDLRNYSTFKAKIVRVFISSTFTDTSVERNALMKDVYPKLKKFCQEHGYEFQVVDMRWGIRAEAMDDHQTLELCIREIENCQNLSMGPSFLSLLSEKYGFRPIPAKIPKDEFRAIGSQIPDESDFRLLLSWYQRDENHRPPVYVLQPISSHIPDFVKYSDETVRKRAVEEWNSVMSRMAGILRAAAAKVFLGSERRKYFASVSETETEKGIFQTNDKEHGCLWFKRNMEGLADATDEEVEKYIDTQDNENEQARVFLANLQNRILNEMKEENVKQYYIKWNPKGVTLDDQEHSDYISKFCQDVYETVSKAIEGKINERLKNEANLAIYEEVLQHITFSKSRCEFFHGREEELQKIHDYLEGSEAYPLVVYGESGCGKTSVLSMVLKCCQEWFAGGPAVVIRYLGITPDSSLIRKLLLSLCQQISILLDREYETSQRKIIKTLEDDLVNLIQTSNSHFTAEKPLVIILDSIDQLSPEDGAFQLSWLPTALPPWAKIVVSAISEDKFDCLKNLQALIHQRCFVSVPLLPIDDAVQIVDELLAANKRTLTKDQNRVLLQAFEKCSLPIFLKVSFEEALRWRSYTPIGDIRLEFTVRGAINALFERVERKHGNLFVRRTLAYITAAKSGLTESELEDILSCDDEVLEDVYQFWVPPVRRIPPLLWLRMKHDFSSYLVDRGADESMVVTWYHRQFKEAAVERYLSDKEETRRIHLAISEYFLGLWANGSQKPFKNKDGEVYFMDRLVASQDLIFRTEDHCHHGPVAFNLRKLNELPFHLIKAEELNLLKEECLCNYEFLLTHLRARGLSDVLDIFELAISVWPEDKDLTTVHETLKLSTNALALWPGQLASQLISRIIKETFKKSKFMETLEKQAKNPSLPALIPHVPCLTSPGGPLLQSLAGSTEPHVSLRLNSDGKTLVSVGEGRQMLVWDVRAGRVARNIDCPDGGTTYACMTSQANIIIISRFGIIKAWYMSTGQPVLDIKGHDESAPVSICIMNGEDALAAFFSETLNIVDLKSGQTLKQYTTKIRSYTEKPVMVMLSSWKQKCLVVHKDVLKESQFSLLLEVFDVSSEYKHDLFRVKTDNDIIGLEIVNNNQILVTYAGLEGNSVTGRVPSGRPSVASSWQKMTLELWDIDSMKPKKKLTTEKEAVRCSCITPDRNEVIMLCNTSFIETACEFMGYIKIHSVVDNNSVTLPLSYPSAITSICGTGFRCIVTTSLDKIIRVWDLERSLNMEASPSEENTDHRDQLAADIRKESKIERMKEEIAKDLTAAKKSSFQDSNVDSDIPGSCVNGIENNDNRDKESPGKVELEKGPINSNEVPTEKSSSSRKSSADTPQKISNDARSRKISNNIVSNWKGINSFPVGKNFLKLRYSNLSSAVHSLVVESGSSLEDVQMACCYENIFVYFARRVVDSVFAAVVWGLDTDIKIRISGLQNPEVCIAKTDTFYLVAVSSGVISLYRAGTGEFVKCKALDIDENGSDRLVPLTNDTVLVVGKGRKTMKLFNIPALDVVRTISVGEHELILRILCSRNMKKFIICTCESVQGRSNAAKFIAKSWDTETLEEASSFEYGTFVTDFSGAKISEDGSTFADMVFDPSELQYRLCIWKENSPNPQLLSCDLPVNVFTLQENQNKMLIGTWNGDLLLYNIDSLTWKRVAKAHIGPLHHVLLSRSGKHVFTIAGAFNSRDRSIRLWNAMSGKMVAEYTPDVKITSITITDDERFIILEIQGKLIKFELSSSNN